MQQELEFRRMERRDRDLPDLKNEAERQRIRQILTILKDSVYTGYRRKKLVNGQSDCCSRFNPNAAGVTRAPGPRSVTMRLPYAFPT